VSWVVTITDHPSMSALAFHEKAGPCQGHVVRQVILFSPFARIARVFGRRGAQSRPSAASSS